MRGGLAVRDERHILQGQNPKADHLSHFPESFSEYPQTVKIPLVLVRVLLFGYE